MAVVLIRPVRTTDEASAVYLLAYEFIEWLRDRYPDMITDIENYLEHQNFDEQIRDVLSISTRRKVNVSWQHAVMSR